MLAPVDHYTTKGVIGFDKARTMVFFLMEPNYSANKRRRETLLSPLIIFGQRKEERWLGFLVLSHKTQQPTHTQCAGILLQLKTLLVAKYISHKTRVTLTPTAGHHFPQNRILSS